MGLIRFSKYLALFIFSEMLQKGLILLSGESLGVEVADALGYMRNP